MKSRNILILLAIPGFDYSNENSAVLNYLKVIRSAFEKNGDSVFFYNELSTGRGAEMQLDKLPQDRGGIKSLLKRLLKTWPFLYQSIAFRKFFKEQEAMVDMIINEKGIDLIIEFYSVGSNVGVELSQKWKVPLHLIFDAPVDEQFLEMYRTKTVHWKQIQNSERDALQMAEKILVYSKACQKYIQDKYSLKAEISVLPCVVYKEGGEIKSHSEEFIIGFIGSFLKWHKVEIIVQAFKKFVHSYPDAKLYLIGFGEEWGRIKNLVAELGLDKSVYQPGFVSEKELTDLKSVLNVGVMPGSNWYGSPLKLFEYAQGEIPFIAPSTPTVSEIFNSSEHCLFIDNSNPVQSLFDSLVYLKENPNEASQMAGRTNSYFNSIFGLSRYQEQLVNSLG